MYTVNVYISHLIIEHGHMCTQSQGFFTYNLLIIN